MWFKNFFSRDTVEGLFGRILFESLIQQSSVEYKEILLSQKVLAKSQLSFDWHELIFIYKGSPKKLPRNELYYMLCHAEISIDSFCTPVSFWVSNGLINTLQFQASLKSKDVRRASISKVLMVVNPLIDFRAPQSQMGGWLSELEVVECYPPLENDRRSQLIAFIEVLPLEYVDLVGSTDGFVHHNFTLCGLREMNAVFLEHKSYYVLIRFEMETRFAIAVERSRLGELFLVRLEDQTIYKLDDSFRRCVENLISGQFTIPIR